MCCALAACGGADGDPGDAGDTGDTAGDGAGATTALAAPGGAESDTVALPIILVSVERRGDNTVYSYEVRNGTPALLRVFSVGLGMSSDGDLSDSPDGGGELTVLPDGTPGDWHRRDEYRLPRTGAELPLHWHALLHRVEETEGVFITFYADSNQFGIRPGQALGGFRIIVPDADDAYRCGHWTLSPDMREQFAGRLSGDGATECPRAADAP